jgi:cellobiose-specific phosphotransferase system component IIC
MMKKLTTSLIFALPVVLFGWACTLLLLAPAEPPFDWMNSMSVVDHNALVAHIDHHYTVATYVITWAIQLGYLAWLGLRWQTQKRGSARPSRNS